MTVARRPTFFLSSTIHDFRDLRGAIKFSLEQRGCRVLASEFNDFGGNLAEHSYEACLSNICEADFFVLLIGARVGGWYDAADRVSITQQEYRTAYRLHLEGRLRLVTFVRDEVWQLREERKELTRVLAERNLAESERVAIAGAPSRFATDASFIATFVDEVGRNAETKAAVAGGGAKPTGNWIHAFKTFRDIHDVLQPLAFTGLTSEEAAYRKALQHELLSVMSRLLYKFEGKVQDPSGGLKRGLEAHPITVATRDRGWISVDLAKWNLFTTAFVGILGVQLETIVIDDALTSTIFLGYDAARGGFLQTPAYDALSDLRTEISRFNSLNTAENLTIVFQTSSRTLGRRTGSHELPAQQVGLLYGLAHRWINIVRLCQALIFHLEGQVFEAPELMPFSPITDFDETIRAELVAVADVRQALGL